MSVTFEGITLFCADVEVSARFYEGALGLTRAPDDGDVVLRLPVKGGAEAAWLLLHPQLGDQIRPHPIGTFAVDDVDAIVRTLREGGYDVPGEPADQPWGVRTADVADPDGYGLTLASPSES